MLFYFFASIIYHIDFLVIKILLSFLFLFFFILFIPVWPWEDLFRLVATRPFLG